MRGLHCTLIVALVWTASTLQPTSLSAQSFWLEPLDDRALYLEALKPSFEDRDLTFASSAWYLSARWAVNENVRLVGELPFAHAAFKDFDDTGENAIGNPYAGVEFGGANTQSFGEFGVRLPLASEDNLATETGAFTDFVDRFEAFLPDILSLVLAGNYRYTSPGGFALRARLAPVLWLDTGDTLADDTELWVLYSALAWYEGDIIGAGGGLSGRFLATEGDLDFGERTFHQLGLFANLTLGRWMPGLQLRFPLDDDLREIIDTVLSLSLGFKLH